MILSPADEAPFPGGGRRASAAEVNEEMGRSVWRIGLDARDAVLETNALLGRVRRTKPAGAREGGRVAGRWVLTDTSECARLHKGQHDAASPQR